MNILNDMHEEARVNYQRSLQRYPGPGVVGSSDRTLNGKRAIVQYSRRGFAYLLDVGAHSPMPSSVEELEKLAQKEDEQAGYEADGAAIKAQEAAQAKQDEKYVLDLFNDGYNVVIGTHPLWAKDGKLVRGLEGHEIDALDRLERQGVVKKDVLEREA